MTFTCTSQVRLHYVLSSEKVQEEKIFPPSQNDERTGNLKIILIHGLFFGNLAGWYPRVTSDLMQFGDVLCYDLRGHGLSECPVAGYRLKDHAQDLHELISEIGWIDKPLCLIGHSYGGRVALEYRNSRPEACRGVALLDSPLTNLEQSNLSLFESVDQILEIMPEDLKLMLSSRGRRADRLLKRWHTLISTTSLTDDLSAVSPSSEEELKKFAEETWGLYGARSGCISSFQLLESCLPSKRLELLDAAGHFLLSEHIVEVTRFLTQMLSEMIASNFE